MPGDTNAFHKLQLLFGVCLHTKEANLSFSALVFLYEAHLSMDLVHLEMQDRPAYLQPILSPYLNQT